MVDPCMYLFLNRGLNMSTGKAAAQVAHAAVEAFRQTPADSNLLRLWDKGKHYKKIVLEGRDEAHMQNIAIYLKDREFTAVVIIDEGMTEVPAHSLTAIGVPLVDKNEPHTAATFSTFDLYKPFFAYVPEVTGKEHSKLTPWRRS